MPEAPALATGHPTLEHGGPIRAWHRGSQQRNVPCVLPAAVINSRGSFCVSDFSSPFLFGEKQLTHHSKGQAS